MARPPMAKLAHQRNQFVTGFGQRIGYLRWDNSLSCPTHNPVGRKLAELRSKNLFADARHKVAQLRETPRTKSQVPHDQNLPLAAQNVDRALHRTPMIVFHTGPRAYKIVRTSLSALNTYTIYQKRGRRPRGQSVSLKRRSVYQENDHDSSNRSKRNSW